jgi:hypothetical protein
LVFFFTVAYQYGWPRFIRYGKSIHYGRSYQSR